jgi:3-oxoacyl-[acyl-carrier protein] reductase
MENLKDKVAIVTGSSRGIGRAIAIRLGKDGANVIVTYTGNQAKANEVVKVIESSGSKAISVQADMSKPEDIKHLFNTTANHFGQLHILVNNAGTFVMKPVVEITLEEFDKLIAVNVRGVFLALKEAVQRIEDGGRIINLSSVITTQSSANSSLYAASKAAVEQFTRSIAKELGARAITVNAVAPGATETDMMPDMVREMAPKMTALGRLGQPEDIADVVAFLASDEARWITGQIIGVNGGMN